MTVYNHNGDPIAALASTLDALDAHLRLSRATAKRSERNRLSLLYIHATAAIIIAPLFLAYSTTNGLTAASWTLLRSIPGAPHSIAAWLFIGGVIAMLGTAARHTGIAIAGLTLLVGWYLSFAATFTYAAWSWWHDGAHTSSMPALYAGPVYLHFGVILAVHLRTLVRMRRDGRP